MNTFEKNRFHQAYLETVERGESMGGDLPEIFRSARFNPHYLTEFGVICCNVGDGPELVAFRGLSPKFITTIEPDSVPSQDTSDNEAKSKVLKVLSEETDATVLHGHSEQLIEILAENQEIQVELVTSLNRLPGDLSADFIKNALRILVPGGMVLISLNSEKHFEFLSDFAKDNLPGVKTHVFTHRTSCAGEVFLAAFKSDSRT